MSNEIANRSHAGMVLQTFEDPEFPPLVLAAWGVDVATLQKVGTGGYIARLTQGMSLTIGADITTARFDFLVLAQGLALPNSIIAFISPDPFGEPLPPPTPGLALQFNYLVFDTRDPDNSAIDADALINLEVRRIPRRGQ